MRYDPSARYRNERPVANNAHVKDSEGIRLYKLLWWGYVTIIPLTALFIYFAVLSNSASVGVISVQALIAIIVNTFALFALKQVLNSNVYHFSYGTGKLENFSAFLLGGLYVPTGLYMMFEALKRLISAPEVGYEISQIALVISTVRMLIVYLFARRLMSQSQNPSPLLESYVVVYRICLLCDLGVLAALIIASGFVNVGVPAIGYRVDPVIAIAVSFYMIFSGIHLVRQNFRALIDLPLPESEQMKIMRVLTGNYNDYDSVGVVYTRVSGRQKFVEIEIGFSAQRSIHHIYDLKSRMETMLSSELPGLRFRIIPISVNEDYSKNSGV